MLFGVKTMSGLRHLRMAWRRRRWKYCAAVEGCVTCMFCCARELEVALDAGGGVLRALAFVAVRQQQDDAGEQVPLGFAGGDELVDDDLRAVGEVAELRLPEDEGLGVVAAVAVLVAEHGGLGEHGVVDLQAGLVGRDVRERRPAASVLDVDEHGVALVEGAALGVLAAEADGRAGLEQRGEGEGLGHAVVDRALAAAHLGALGEQLLDLGVDVEAFGRGGELAGERGDLGGVEAGRRHLEAGLPRAARVVASQ